MIEERFGLAGVRVTEGPHHITLRYSAPRYLTVSRSVSLFALSLLLACLAHLTGRPRRP